MRAPVAIMMIIGLLLSTSCSVYLQNPGRQDWSGHMVYTDADTLVFKTGSGKRIIESVVCNDSLYSVGGRVFHFPLSSINGGRKKMAWDFNFQDGKTKSVKKDILVTSHVPPLVITIDSAKLIPHDTALFTQGLEFYNDVLYESAGRYSKSSINKIDYRTGSIICQQPLDSALFAEGLTFYDDTLYLLTWKEGTLLRLDADMHIIEQKAYPYEGWGVSKFDPLLVASDGTDKLYFFSGGNNRFCRELTVYNNLGTVTHLNELEWVDGYIWANVLGRNSVVVINPADGRVKYELDLSGLIKQHQLQENGVLNGIAYHQSTGCVYFTGKNWPVYLVCKIPDEIQKNK